MRWSLLSGAALCAALSVEAAAKDVPYPAGKSTQQLGERTFGLAVPEGTAPPRGWGLLLAIDSDGKSIIDEFAALADDGFVVCSPVKVHQGGGWATSEAKEILDLLDHIRAVLPIGKGHLHVVTTETWGFAAAIAFEKRAQSASLCFANPDYYRGRTPPDTAKKQMAVLVLSPKHTGGEDTVKALGEKVRTLEVRDGTSYDPYFRYWLLVADDRFTPGFDLSFPWMEEAPAPPEPKPGETPAPTPARPESTLDEAKASAAAGKRGAFVYFWSKSDAAKPEAKALQNDVFMRQEVRNLGVGLVPVKLERERNEKAFSGFGLRSTPAVVVLDSSFGPVKSFEGSVDGAALLAALRKAAPEQKKTK